MRPRHERSGSEERSGRRGRKQNDKKDKGLGKDKEETGRDRVGVLLVVSVLAMGGLLWARGPLHPEMTTQELMGEGAQDVQISRDEVLSKVRERMRETIESSATRRAAFADISVLVFDTFNVHRTPLSPWLASDALSTPFTTLVEHVPSVRTAFPSSLYDALHAHLVQRGSPPSHIKEVDNLYHADAAAADFLTAHTSEATLPMQHSGLDRPTPTGCYVGDLSTVEQWWPQWKAYAFQTTRVTAKQLFVTAVYDSIMVRAFQGYSGGWEEERSTRCNTRSKDTKDGGQLTSVILDKFAGVADVIILHSPPPQMMELKRGLPEYDFIPAACCQAPAILLKKSRLLGTQPAKQPYGGVNFVVASALGDQNTQIGIVGSGPHAELGPAELAVAMSNSYTSRRMVTSGPPDVLVAHAHDFVVDSTNHETAKHMHVPTPVGLSSATKQTLQLTRLPEVERREKAKTLTAPHVTEPVAAAQVEVPVTCGTAPQTVTQGAARVCGIPDRSLLVFEERTEVNAAWRAAIVSTGVSANGKSLPFTTVTVLGEVLQATAVDARYSYEYVVKVMLNGAMPGAHFIPAFNITATIYTSAPERKDAEGHRSNTELHSFEVEFLFDPRPGENAGVFKWVPMLHPGKGLQSDIRGVASEDAFRSPAVIGAARGSGFALIPDLSTITMHQKAGTWSVPSSLDLHAGSQARGSGKQASATALVGDDVPMRAWVGLASSHVEKGYPVRDTAKKIYSPPLHSGVPLTVFHLLTSVKTSPQDLTAAVNAFLWKRFGRQHLRDACPQVQRYADYVSYGYNATSPKAVGEYYGHVAQTGRVSYHALENDAMNLFGLLFFGGALKNDTVRGFAKGVMDLALSAPRAGGVFPTAYNYNTKTWENTLREHQPAYTSPDLGYDATAMGATRWWMYQIASKLPRQDPSGSLMKAVVSYAKLLAEKQDEDGSLPAYLDGGKEVVKCRSRPKTDCLPGTTALGGAVLAAAAAEGADEGLARAAILAGTYVVDEVIAKQRFFDFEVKNVTTEWWADGVTGIAPLGSLSAVWCANQMHALYKLTNGGKWLSAGDYCLQILNLLQQVWAPPRLLPKVGSLYGGYGASNADLAWSERQHLAVPVLCDYYVATGKVEYLERAVAAAKAGFALMAVEKGREGNCSSVVGVGEGRYRGPVLGMGWNDPWEGAGERGVSMGVGGAATAAAYLLKRFGAVWIDLSARMVVGIDGVIPRSLWAGNTLTLSLTNVFEPEITRQLTLRFGLTPSPPDFRLQVNGKDISLDATAYEKGLTIQI